MELDDYFEHKRSYKRYDNHYSKDHHSDHRYSPRYSSRGMEHYGFYLVNKMWNNRKLRILLIIGSLVLVFIVIMLLIALIPLITRIVDLIAQTGLNGITDSVTGFLEKLWNGSAS